MIVPGSPSEEGFCAKCRYPLRGLPEPRCPECGEGFDPYDPHTFLVADQRPMGLLAKKLFRPPGRVLSTSCVLSFFLGLVGSAIPGEHFLLGLSVVLLLVLFVFWFQRLVVYLIVGWWHGRPREEMRATRAWTLLPTLCALLAVLHLLQVPIYLGFFVNEPFLDRVVVKVAASSGTALKETRVGLYPVNQVLKVGNGARIKVRGAGGGFGHFPNGTPSGSRMISYRRLWGHWYTWQY